MRPQRSDPAMCAIIFIALVVLCLTAIAGGVWFYEAFLDLPAIH